MPHENGPGRLNDDLGHYARRQARLGPYLPGAPAPTYHCTGPAPVASLARLREIIADPDCQEIIKIHAQRELDQRELEALYQDEPSEGSGH